MKCRKYFLLTYQTEVFFTEEQISSYQCFGDPGSFYIVAPGSSAYNLTVVGIKPAETERLEVTYPILCQLPLGVREAEKLV